MICYKYCTITRPVHIDPPFDINCYIDHDWFVIGWVPACGMQIWSTHQSRTNVPSWPMCPAIIMPSKEPSRLETLNPRKLNTPTHTTMIMITKETMWLNRSTYTRHRGVLFVVCSLFVRCLINWITPLCWHPCLFAVWPLAPMRY